MHTDIHTSSGIRTHDPSVLAGAKTVHGLDGAATDLHVGASWWNEKWQEKPNYSDK
jgi:hypothetical protein